MLKMGFAEDVETILADTPDDKQVALFSATMPAADPPDLEAVPERSRRDHGQEQDDDVAEHHPALPDRVVPAEDRRAHAHPRGRELRGDDRLRPHQERDRDARREAARPRLSPRGDQRRRRPGAARAHRQPAEVGQARHPGRDRCRRPRPRRRAHQPRRQLRHPDRHRVVRAPHRPHRPRRPQRATRSASSRRASAACSTHIEKATRQPLTQMQLPTVDDVNVTRLARFDDAITAALAQTDRIDALPRHHRALRRATTTCRRPTSPPRSPSSRRARPRCCSSRSRAPQRARERDDRGDRGDRPDRGGRDARARARGAPPARSDVPMATYRIAVGKRHKVEPRQIVGALANEGGLSAARTSAQSRSARLLARRAARRTCPPRRFAQAQRHPHLRQAHRAASRPRPRRAADPDDRDDRPERKPRHGN